MTLYRKEKDFGGVQVTTRSTPKGRFYCVLHIYVLAVSLNFFFLKFSAKSFFMCFHMSFQGFLSGLYSGWCDFSFKRPWKLVLGWGFELGLIHIYVFSFCLCWIFLSDSSVRMVPRGSNCWFTLAHCCCVEKCVFNGQTSDSACLNFASEGLTKKRREFRGALMSAEEAWWF